MYVRVCVCVRVYVCVRVCVWRGNRCHVRESWYICFVRCRIALPLAPLKCGVLFAEYTTEEAIDHVGFGRFQLRAGLVTVLSWVSALGGGVGGTGGSRGFVGGVGEWVGGTRHCALVGK